MMRLRQLIYRGESMTQLISLSAPPLETPPGWPLAILPGLPHLHDDFDDICAYILLNEESAFIYIIDACFL